MIYRNLNRFDGKLIFKISDKSTIRKSIFNKYDYDVLNSIYKKEILTRNLFLWIFIVFMIFFTLFSYLQFITVYNILIIIIFCVISFIAIKLFLTLSINDLKKDIKSRIKLLIEGKIQFKGSEFFDRAYHYYFVIKNERIYITYSMYIDHSINDCVRIEIAENSGYILNTIRIN